MAAGFSLKDQLFNAAKVRHLADRFARADAGFDAAGFEARVMDRLPDLELKQRIAWIATCLGDALPGPLPAIAPVLRAALPAPLDPALKDDDFGDFIYAPLGELVVDRGLEEHPDLGLDLLEAITQRFSMEWAIRPFLNRWPDRVLARMDSWARHDNYHVRRLVSEGTRPRLPWGQGIDLPVAAPLPLLEQLHADPTRYVTRSVANHLNDLTRHDPDLVMDRLEQWRATGRQAARELDWMTAHALRGLVKQGHPRALAMLGYDAGAEINCTLALLTPAPRIGAALEFEVTLAAAQQQPVLVDYIIRFARPDGRERRKVFKLKQARVEQGRPLVLRKRHPLRGNASTFTLHPGQHRIELQVNGRLCAEAAFDLQA